VPSRESTACRFQTDPLTARHHSERIPHTPAQSSKHQERAGHARHSVRWSGTRCAGSLPISALPAKIQPCTDLKRGCGHDGTLHDRRGLQTPWALSGRGLHVPGSHADPCAQQLGKLGLGWVRVTTDTLRCYTSLNSYVPKDTSRQAARFLPRWMTNPRRKSAGRTIPNRTWGGGIRLALKRRAEIPATQGESSGQS
jgi:hypothetical protein